MLIRCVAVVVSIACLFPASALCDANPPSCELFVATDGNDSWSGRLPEPNADRSDGPLATLTAARDAVRKLLDHGPVGSPIRVVVRGGTYRIQFRRNYQHRPRNRPDPGV